MSAPSISQFTSLLEQSNLLSADQLSTARAELANADESRLPQVVAAFAERGWITRWQGRMLLDGRHAFFLRRYKLLDHLGEGGMGSVLKAEQTPLGRLVAIKTLRKEVASNSEMVSRFHREIQAAAGLSHPNIVAAFDADSVGSQHFLVLEFVEGNDLAELLKGNRKLPMGEACEYIRQAAVGLQHAHERGMVHRDIKPSNLLLTTGSNERPLVKVLDMGLARIETGGSDELTQTGQIMGTPDYISPEQGRDSKIADARSDIYSLGCTLFRLLTGRVPFLRDGAIEKITARLTEEPPTLRSVLADAPAELEDVQQKMLAREPAERYQTADDVIRALAPFAVVPQPGSGLSAVALTPVPAKIEDAGKPIEPAMQEFLQLLATEAADENEAPPVGASLAETVVGFQQNADAAHAPTITILTEPATVPSARPNLIGDIAERNRAERRRLRNILCAIAAFVAVVGGYVVWDKAGKTQVVVNWPLDERDGAELEVDGRPQKLPNQAQIVLDGDSGRRMLRLSRDGYQVIEKTWDLARGEEVQFEPQWKPTPETIRALRWNELQAEVASIATLPTDFGESTDLKHRIESNLAEFNVTPERIRETANLIAQLPSPLDALQRSDIDPYELRVAGRGDPKQAPRELVAVFGDSRLQHSGMLIDLQFTPDGNSIVSAGEDGAVIVWDVETGEARHFVENRVSQYNRISVDPQGRWIAFPTEGNQVQLVNLASGRSHRVLRDHKDLVWSTAFSPDGRLLATASKDQTVKLWNSSTGNLIHTLSGHTQEVRYLTFSSDGKHLASAAEDKTVRLWNVAEGTIQQTIEHKGLHAAYDLAFEPDSTRLAVERPPSGIKIYDISDSDETSFSEINGSYSAIRYTADGTHLAAVAPHIIDVYDTERNSKVHTLTPKELQSFAVRVSFSPDGELLAIGCRDGAIRLWDTKTWRQVNHPQRVTAADIDVDGSRLAMAAADNSVRVVNTATGKELQRLPPQPSSLRLVRFVPQHDWLVAYDGEIITCWDLSAQRLLHSFAFHQPAHKPPIDISPDGRLLAAGSFGHPDYPIPVIVWNLETGQLLFKLEGHKSIVYEVAFDWTGKRLYSADRSGKSMLVWDVETGKQLNSIETPRATYGHFEFLPDRTAIVNVSYNVMSISLPSRALGRSWRHQTHNRVLTSTGESIARLAISPECETLAVGGSGGAVDLYSLGKAGGREKSIEYGSWLGWTQNLRYTPDGRHLLVTNFNGTVYVLRMQEWRTKSATTAK